MIYDYTHNPEQAKAPPAPALADSAQGTRIGPDNLARLRLMVNELMPPRIGMVSDERSSTKLCAVSAL